MEQPGLAESRFQVGAVITHPGAATALSDDPVDLVFQLVAHHLQHAEPCAHGWLSAVRYRGQQIAVTTVTELNETNVFATAGAPALGEEIRARTRGDLQA